MSRGVTIIGDVAAYLDSRRDAVVSIEELLTRFSGVNRGSMQRTVLQLTDSLEIEIVSQGRAWIYRGPKLTTTETNAAARAARDVGRADRAYAARAEAAKQEQTRVTPASVGALFECIGTTQRGLLLRGDDGHVWTATQL
jgi:hypothetical protein